jgi:hypothetical protein
MNTAHMQVKTHRYIEADHRDCMFHLTSTNHGDMSMKATASPVPGVFLFNIDRLHASRNRFSPKSNDVSLESV